MQTRRQLVRNSPNQKFEHFISETERFEYNIYKCSMTPKYESLTEKRSCASQPLCQRNTSEQTEQVELIFKGAMLLRNLLIKELNRNLVLITTYIQIQQLQRIFNLHI